MQSPPFGLGIQPVIAAMPREKRSLMLGAAIFWAWTAAVRDKTDSRELQPDVRFDNLQRWQAYSFAAFLSLERKIITRKFSAIWAA